MTFLLKDNDGLFAQGNPAGLETLARSCDGTLEPFFRETNEKKVRFDVLLLPSNNS
jgi:hypothetical protein